MPRLCWFRIVTLVVACGRLYFRTRSRLLLTTHRPSTVSHQQIWPTL